MKTPRPIPTLTEDEAAFVIELIGPELENGCMPWLGKPFCTGTLHNTYGIVSLRDRNWAAHRVVYTLLKGPIPANMVLDHLCGFGTCVNPAHLDPVPSAENSHREALRNRERLIAQARVERAKLVAVAVERN